FAPIVAPKRPGTRRDSARECRRAGPPGAARQRPEGELMRRILLGLGSFAIWFGGAVLCARAEEITWRSARPAGGVVQAGHQAEAPAPRPAATLGPPRAVLGPPRPLEEAAP